MSKIGEFTLVLVEWNGQLVVVKIKNYDPQSIRPFPIHTLWVSEGFWGSQDMVSKRRKYTIEFLARARHRKVSLRGNMVTDTTKGFCVTDLCPVD